MALSSKACHLALVGATTAAARGTITPCSLPPPLLPPENPCAASSTAESTWLCNRRPPLPSHPSRRFAAPSVSPTTLHRPPHLWRRRTPCSWISSMPHPSGNWRVSRRGQREGGLCAAYEGPESAPIGSRSGKKTAGIIWSIHHPFSLPN